LRDSFASHLLSAGVPLVYVSRQLGHKSQTLTERCYAKYLPGGDVYQPPEVLEVGEVPADLLARITRPKQTDFPMRSRQEPSRIEKAQGVLGLGW
jgi:hypothetical protein